MKSTYNNIDNGEISIYWVSKEKQLVDCLIEKGVCSLRKKSNQLISPYSRLRFIKKNTYHSSVSREDTTIPHFYRNNIKTLRIFEYTRSFLKILPSQLDNSQLNVDLSRKKLAILWGFKIFA